MKENKKFIIIGCVAIAVVAIIIATVVAVTMQGGKRDTTSTAKPTYSDNAVITEKETTQKETITKKETTTKEAKKSPKDCVVTPKKIYDKVKPFFAKYGYNFDEWAVTLDNEDVFMAETLSEAVVLQDSSLVVNLDLGGNTTRGLQVHNDGKNIQFWFDGGEKNKAYELLDIIFDDAYVDNKKLSEYIESEYESYLNEGNVANWTNGGIKYTIQFNDDLTFISLYRN